MTGNGFDASEDGTGRGTPLVPDVAATVTSKWAKGVGGPAGSASETSNMVVDAKWWDGGQTADSLTTTSDAQRMPDKQRFQAVLDSASGYRMSAFGQYEDDDSASTLKQRDHKDATDLVVTPAVLLTMRDGKPGGGKGPLLSEEQSLTLATGNGQTRFQPQAFRKSKRAQSDTDDETRVADGGANTLNVFDVGDTRTTHAIVEPTPIQDTREVEKKQNGLGVGQPGEPSFTLDTTSRAGFGATYGVRRLTPVECERLQSFPDGWTEPSGSDSARYKAMGNAVTVNVVRWILSRLP